MKKNNAATDLASNHRVTDAISIIRESKGNENSLIVNKVSSQMPKIVRCLADTDTDGKTRLMVAKETGIERASVCRRVADLREAGEIWSCGVRKCVISKFPAEYLTTNYRIALRHFVTLCKDCFLNLNSDDQLVILSAIKSYCIDGKTTLDIFGPDNGRCRSIWDNEVKPLIDREYGNK